LDSDVYTEREAASKELVSWGMQIEPDLRHELQQEPSVENRRRLQMLLNGLATQVSPGDVRRARAVVVLKWAKTPEARRLLQELAKGAPEAQVTRDAKAALRFLEHR
jgi:hypothetical protein